MAKCITLFITLIVCASSFPQTYLSPAIKTDTVKTVKGKVVYGVASYYAKSLEGTETTTGEIFHHDGNTAASNKFKLNTWVRVTNLRNGKSVVVRINDRMSKEMEKIGRVVDLSRTAAAKLNYISGGLARVKVEEVTAGTAE